MACRCSRFGVGLLLRIDQIGAAACPRTTRAATVGVVLVLLLMVLMMVLHTATCFRHLQHTLRSSDLAALQCIQGAIAAIQKPHYFFHYGPVHVSAGVDLLQLPLQRFDLSLQDHRFNTTVTSTVRDSHAQR